MCPVVVRRWGQHGVALICSDELRPDKLLLLLLLGLEGCVPAADRPPGTLRPLV